MCACARARVCVCVCVRACVSVCVCVCVCVCYTGTGAVAQVCSLPEMDDYERLILDTYTTSVSVELAETKFVCVSDDVDTATFAIVYGCDGQECEMNTVEALLDLRCGADLWTGTRRTIVTTISNIETGSNCSRCMNATEREQTYPDNERSTYTEENHCLGKMCNIKISTRVT